MSFNIALGTTCLRSPPPLVLYRRRGVSGVLTVATCFAFLAGGVASTLVVTSEGCRKAICTYHLQIHRAPPLVSVLSLLLELQNKLTDILSDNSATHSSQFACYVGGWLPSHLSCPLAFASGEMCLVRQIYPVLWQLSDCTADYLRWFH